MSLIRMQRRAAPASLAILLCFVASLAPQRAEAATDDPVVENKTTPQSASDRPQPEPNASEAKSPAPDSTRERRRAPDRAAPERRPDREPSQGANPKEGTDGNDSKDKVIEPPVDDPTPLSLPTGENKSGVTAQSISVPKGPGTIEGMGESFSAQASTGIATFSIPIAMPAARGDTQPSLALSYSSASGNGIAGIGWDAGVPFIARQTDRGLPSYEDEPQWHARQDRFVYNGGQELVPVESLLPGEQLPTWATGWQYFRPRVEGSYLRFFWNQPANLWRVQDKTGVVLELGVVGGETDALEADPDNATHVYRWNLKRSIDAHGNEVRYAYFHDGNRAYLSDIYDTAPPGASLVAAMQWAHHTRLVYEPRPDVTHAFTRGWHTTQALRLARVDVTAKGGDASQARALLRRYHLSYLPGLHSSLLVSVQVEGRCPAPVYENDEGELAASACPRLPAMNLGYTHVATDADGNPDLDNGFEKLDMTVRSMIDSPELSVDDTYTDLFDINSDALPDVVQMRPVPELGWKHGVWYQGADGIGDRFTEQFPLGVEGLGGVTAASLSKSSPVVAALDLDGDATIDLVHMPQEGSYSIYTPSGSGHNFVWKGRSVTTADGLDARIDLTNDASLLRVFDINGDGLVDVLKTGSSYQVWYSLGRYPGGDGLFGTATWTGKNAAQLGMAPELRCVPWSSGSVVFGGPEVKLADMNGDGIDDIVRLRSNDARYWPGRGDGSFGTGPLGCPGDSHSENSYVLMADSPDYSSPSASALQLRDVNGDGTADLVQIRTDEVDVWLNVDGTSWQPRRIITGTPSSANYGKRVRLTDMNGSGTPDIVWASGLAYKYIDLAGGKRPWLLNRIDNGLGKTTKVEYTTSTEAMLAAERAGDPWQSKTPVVQHMVSRITVGDNLSAIGRPEGVYETEYTYRNPIFDGLQREFRGFRNTTVRTLGDANSPTSESRTEFLLGESPYTDSSDRWRDNPNEALKGLPTVAETRGGDAYLSTTATTYVKRKLYEGRDGRGVYVAFAKQTDAWLYDTAEFDGSAITVQTAVDSALVETGDDVVTAELKVRAQAGTKHTRSVVRVDTFGNRTHEIAYGVVGEDETITSVTKPELVPTPSEALGEGNWSWRTHESWVQGDNGVKRNWARTDYDSFGDPIESSVFLSAAMTREEMRRTAGLASLPMPPPDDTWITTAKTRYDALGNSIFTWAAGGALRPGHLRRALRATADHRGSVCGRCRRADRRQRDLRLRCARAARHGGLRLRPAGGNAGHGRKRRHHGHPLRRIRAAGPHVGAQRGVREPAERRADPDGRVLPTRRDRPPRVDAREQDERRYRRE